MDREDIQSRRAANQVWNGAENYDVRPEFQSYDLSLIHISEPTRPY